MEIKAQALYVHICLQLYGHTPFDCTVPRQEFQVNGNRCKKVHTGYCITHAYCLPAHWTDLLEEEISPPQHGKSMGWCHANIAAFNPHYLIKVEACRQKHRVKAPLGITSSYSAATASPPSSCHPAHCQSGSLPLALLPSQSNPFPFWSPAAESPWFPLELLQKGKKERVLNRWLNRVCIETHFHNTSNHYLVKIQTKQTCPIRMKERFRWKGTCSVLSEQCPPCVAPWTISQHLVFALMPLMLFLCVFQGILYTQMAVRTYWKWLHMVSWRTRTQDANHLWSCWTPCSVKARKIKPALA